MKQPNGVVLAGLILIVAALPARAAVISLASLTSPTVQTLIGSGSDGVTVGPFRFYDFTFAGSSSTTGARSAAQVAVQPVTDDGFGLRFLSSWFAAGGSTVADVITYKLQLLDPSLSVGQFSLFSDGTAPLPAAGTFASTSLSARKTGGAIAGRVLSTFDDGHTTPIDTTQSDLAVDGASFAPQALLSITNAITTTSTGGAAFGAATASVVENTFVAVPEPRMTTHVFLPITMLAMLFTRRSTRRRRARRAQRHWQFGLGAAVG